MADKRVTIIGAGITGLTAAHELVERGFKVEVIERLGVPFDGSDCQVGGMARTQWCVIPYSEEDSKEEKRSYRKAVTMSKLGDVLNRPIRFNDGSFAIDLSNAGDLKNAVDGMKSYLDDWERSALTDRWLHMLVVQGYATEREVKGVELDPRRLEGEGKLTAEDVKLVLYAEGRRWERGTESPAKTLALIRAAVVCNRMFGDRLAEHSFLPVVPVCVGTVVEYDIFDPPAHLHDVVFSLFERQVPGEHGYRYFPGFYRHVFDTMKRTPILERRTIPHDEREQSLDVLDFWESFFKDKPNKGDKPIRLPSMDIASLRTVFDNLVPTASFSIAMGNQKAPEVVPRLRPRSLREVRRLLRLAFEGFGMTVDDAVLFEIKILQYLTSCSSRRETYEEMTWWDYLDADRYGKPFQDLIDRWPQALIGVRAKLADARTIGTVSMQLILDQLTPSGFRDGTLNGPTSQAWLDPWKAYLEKRGVIFKHETVETITPDDSYTILAVSLPQAKRMVTRLWGVLPKDQWASADARDLRALHEWDVPASGVDGGIPIPEPKDGALRLYSGIQFYLSEDLGPADGHLFFASSAWRLSAISQAQFWRQRFLTKGGLKEDPFGVQISVLSVDIGDWYEESPEIKKSASACTRDELANEVWRQIEEGIRQRGFEPPDPIAYHIDDDVIYKPPSANWPEIPTRNRAPYLVNLAGDWKKRPGDTTTTAYTMFRGLVLAGTYMKTKTRLVTMEAANESGRRAANAVLRDYAAKTGNPVPLESPLWDPEDNEVDDVDFLKDLDQALFDRGLPHMLEILDVAGLVAKGGSPTPEAIVTGILEGIGVKGPTFAAQAGIPMELIRRVLSSLFE